MKVADVMTRNVLTVTPGHSIAHAARIMLDNRISGLPVVDLERLVGMITQGDLLRRMELGNASLASVWSQSVSREGAARDYVRSHSWKVGDVMSKPVATTSPDADLSSVGSMMLARGVRRLPVLDNDKLVGVVSRADLLQAILAAPSEGVAQGDEALQTSVHARLREISGIIEEVPLAIVGNGIVHLWGSVGSEAERDAIRVVVDAIPGVHGVVDHLALFRPPPLVSIR